MSKERIVIGSDHAGYEMKNYLKNELSRRGFEVVDVSEPQYDADDDYPVYSSRVAGAVSEGTFTRGVTVCGTGIGASMTANRFKKVRAALCINPEMAKMARAHNDSNVLVIGGRITPLETASQILDAWLNTQPERGRHDRRIELLEKTEQLYNDSKAG